MIAIIIIGIIVFFIVFAMIFDDNNNFEKTIKNEQKINSIKKEDRKFSPSKSFISKNKNSGIEIDHKRKLLRIYFIDKEKEIQSKIYSFDDLIETEIKVDNHSIIKTSRISQLAGVAVGGVVAGGLGAIIGGLSGTKMNKEYIRNIDLYVKVNDYEKPLYKVNFLSNVNEFGIENKSGFKKDSKEVKEAIENTEYWHNIFDLILSNSGDKRASLN